MKINIRAFTIAFTVVMSILILVITVWARLSGIFGREFIGTMLDDRPTFITVTLFHFGKLILDDLHTQAFICQNSFQLLNQRFHLFVLFDDFVSFHSGKTLKSHFKNGFRLNLR